MKTLVIGTRGSKLALTQANYVKNLLEEEGFSSEIKIIKTSGDMNQNIFQELPLKKLFVKEIEEELLSGTIDLAVHSMKDMPYDEVEGLTIGAFPQREDPRDAMIVRHHPDTVKIIGTGSERRRVQLLDIYNEVEIKPIRGNVDTRILKMQEGQYDAIILAAAGLKRLGLDNMISKYFEVDEMVPSPCQGILGIQCRENDVLVKNILTNIDKPELRKIVTIERLFGKIHNGGCKAPIGAYAELQGDMVRVFIMKYTDKVIKNEIIGKADDIEFFYNEFIKF